MGGVLDKAGESVGGYGYCYTGKINQQRGQKHSGMAHINHKQDCVAYKEQADIRRRKLRITFKIFGGCFSTGGSSGNMPGRFPAEKERRIAGEGRCPEEYEPGIIASGKFRLGLGQAFSHYGQKIEIYSQTADGHAYYNKLKP